MAKHKREKESIKDFFDLKEKLFESKMYYPGEWIIGDDFDRSVCSGYEDIKHSTLYLNSIKNGNGNAFEKFLEKRFKPLVEYAYGAGYKDLASEVYPYITMQEDDDKRYLSFGKASILSGLIVKCFPMTLESIFQDVEKRSDLTDDSALELLRECLIADRNVIKDVRDNPLSEYKEIVNVINPDGTPVSVQRRQEKLNEIISNITAKIRATKYMDKLLGAKIDYKEFMECFDYDKLCLIIALSAYLDVNKHFEEEGICPGSMMFLHDYVLTVEHLRKHNVRYNENIKICTRDQKGNLRERTIDTNEIIRLFEQIIKEHPDIKSNEIDLDALFKKFNVSEEYAKSLGPVEYTNLLQDLVDRDKKLEAITLNWEILPVKEGVKPSEVRGLGRRPSTDPTFDIENRSNIFNDYIASLSPVLQLKGINNFDGYIAYVFNNSKVILEKPKGIKKSEYYGATYIMNLNNFFELSKLSRTEIIEGLQSGDITGVTRVYHTYDEKNSSDPIHTYKARIERHLEGSEYSKDKIDSIYAIIENERSKKDENGYQRTRISED